MPRPLVVHITCDYPDAVQPRKTRAIANLVEGTADAFDHRVYSLNRVPIWSGGGPARPGAGFVVADDGQVASWTYAAPDRGVLLATAMRRVADRILADIAAKGLAPALIQGHKLSIEGLATAPVAAELALPYALSLQGNTDQKVLRVRRDLRPRYAAIYRGAARLFPFAPWIADWCTARLGTPAAAPVILPCVLGHDAVLPPAERPPLLVSAFHLQHHRLKNVDRLIAATGIAARQLPSLRLEIGGDGPEAARGAIDAAIARQGVDRMRRVGPIAAADMQGWMNGAAAFAMPSLHETFGMVFVEALLGGCPIVYPQGRSVEGYFDGAGFALGVPPRDTGAIADAIVTLVRDQSRRKAELARWQQSPAAAAFRRDAILATYRTGLESIIDSAS